MNDKFSPQTNLYTSPKLEPTLELISRAAPSLEAQSVRTQEEIPEEGGQKKVSTNLIAKHCDFGVQSLDFLNLQGTYKSTSLQLDRRLVQTSVDIQSNLCKCPC